MNVAQLDPADREERLHGVLLAYLEAAGEGRPPDRDRLLAEHAEFADELRAFFAGREEMERVAAPLRLAADGPPCRPGEAVGGTLGDFRLLREVGRGGMGV